MAEEQEGGHEFEVRGVVSETVGHRSGVVVSNDYAVGDDGMRRLISTRRYRPLTPADRVEPCPWCGDDQDLVAELIDRETAQVHCMCEARGPTGWNAVGDPVAAAVAVWNERTRR
jgi:hypothetical protein